MQGGINGNNKLRILMIFYLFASNIFSLRKTVKTEGETEKRKIIDLIHNEAYLLSSSFYHIVYFSEILYLYTMNATVEK